MLKVQNTFSPQTKRFDAILWLQCKRRKYQSGSYKFELYDKAIELATSPSRQVTAYFERSLLRDAKKLLKDSNNQSRETYLEDNHINVVAMNSDSPDFQIEYSMIREFVNLRCQKVHPRAKEVFQLLHEGNAIKYIAKKLDLSISLTYKLVAIVKAALARGSQQYL